MAAELSGGGLHGSTTTSSEGQFVVSCDGGAMWRGDNHSAKWWWGYVMGCVTQCLI